MADPTPEQRKLSSKEVIVYDPITFAVTLEKAEDYKGKYSAQRKCTSKTQPYISIDYIEDPDTLLKIAPRLGDRVEVYEGIAMIARIKLNHLGWQANIKRAFGNATKSLSHSSPLI